MFCEHIPRRRRRTTTTNNKTMAFSPNPLSLSVPDPAFESWLRDSGYLDLLDHRTSAAAAAAAAPASSSSSSSPAAAATSSVSEDVVSSITGGFFASLLSRLVTVSSLLTINPFSKLSADDFSSDTPPWTTGFFGACDSYSFPASSQQARMRVHENIKRFARNYATLFIVFFACALYQMPLALVGLLASLALWELFKYCSDRWKFDRHPSARRLVIGIGQCATMVFLTFLNVQMALFYALAVSYSVMLLHAGFRKLTPSKKPSRGR